MECPSCRGTRIVEADGSEWCRDCGREVSNVVIGDMCHAWDRMRAAPLKNQDLPKSGTESGHALSILESTLSIPQPVLEQAFAVFSDLQARQDTRSSTQRALLASCVYRTCVAHNVNRSCKDIRAALGITSKKFNKAEKVVHSSVESSGACDDDYGVTAAIHKHAVFLDHGVRSRLAIKTIRCMLQVFEACPRVHGKSPDKLCACALFVMATLSGISMCGACDREGIKCAACVRFVCDNFGVGKVTLQQHHKLLYPLLSQHA